MADKGIIFSGPMVKALLAGQKTQTRRIAKITAIMGNKVAVTSPEESLIELEDGEFRRGICHYESTGALSGPYRLPYAVGDRLWVREAIRFDKEWDDCKPRDFDQADAIFYEADGHCDTRMWGDPFTLGRLRSPIHMPRWASRLTLTVTEVRVQRLAEISGKDALAEGVQCPTCEAMQTSACHGAGCFASVAAYRDLWNSLHGPAAWAANPWVVALTFTVRHGNIDVPS